jgi:tryptophan halogenase
MKNSPCAIQHILIVGGGSSGWMTAAALANTFGTQLKITLIESNEIGTVGVGEATIPPIKLFNQQLGINESEFLKHTHGTIKLGIQFIDWAKQEHQYFHPFGSFGADFDQVPLYQYWLRERSRGDTSELLDYSLAWCAARAGKVVLPNSDKRLVQSTSDYAYHFDAALYANYLRRYSEARGVIRCEGKVVDVKLRPDTGFIESVQLENGNIIAADLFIDCSGFRGLLIEEALHTGYQNWSAMLPCNSAIAAPCTKAGEFTPYTKATARTAGWQWRIPLQHRTGNGHVYCNDFISDAAAQDILVNSLDGDMLAEPRQLRFTTGHRNKFWNKNCVAIGLAAGFMEPLESTSLHLVQTAIRRLIILFPNLDFNPHTEQEFNRLTLAEYIGIRDFLILHYKATARTDSEFWRYCANMPIPDSLSYKMEQFSQTGQIVSTQTELFVNPNWLAVMIGQGIIPKHYPALVDYRNHIDASNILKSLRNTINEVVEHMPTHEQFIAQYCLAENH